jgi:hypothetical protein
VNRSEEAGSNLGSKYLRAHRKKVAAGLKNFQARLGSVFVRHVAWLKGLRGPS